MYCENCNKEHDGSFASGRFCCRSCSNSFSSNLKRKEVNEKVSKTLKGRPNPHKGKPLSYEHKEAIKLGHKNSNKQQIYKGFSNEQVFVENSTYGPSKLKNRIIKDNLFPYICKECGNVGFHNDKPLTLQVDHINGINSDHRLENLRFLCPNCHTQQDTYCSKNIVYQKANGNINYKPLH